jgi:hypothetical protein
MFKEELTPSPHVVFQQIKEGALPNSFYKTSINLISKPKEKYRSTVLTNIIKNISE